MSVRTPKPRSLHWLAALLMLVTIVLVTGCVSPQRRPQPRPFVFGRDTLAFTNELTWEYHRDANGAWTSRKREPAPTYTLHCFPMVRACREFFLNARFEPSQPRLSPEITRKRVRQVIATDSRKSLPMEQRIVLPGYPDLTSFSHANENMLKHECGTATSSYFQRGHWRMVLPFSKRHQERTAEQILAGLQKNWPPILHLLTFPKLSINHAVLVFGGEQTKRGIKFSIYDPNQPDAPGTLEYDRKLKRFELGETAYFPGGPVEVYEVYRGWKY